MVGGHPALLIEEVEGDRHRCLLIGDAAALPRQQQGGRHPRARPLTAGLIALAAGLGFVLLRLGLAAGGDLSGFVRAAAPYAHAGLVPRGLRVFPGDSYDGQFYYRLALDPADLRHTAYGITMDLPFRVQRIGYPALARLLSAGRPAWVPVSLAAVNVLAADALGLVAAAHQALCL